MKLLLVTCSLLCAAYYVVGQQQQNGNGPMAYKLAADSENVVGQVNEAFTCAGKGYGYYADVQNECKVFHVCRPLLDENEQPTGNFNMWSFFCGNQTLFDQATMVCKDAAEVNCAGSEQLYSVNDNFFKVEPKQ